MTRVADCYVKARVSLYPTEIGGRSHFIRTGFRPNHVFSYVDGQVLTNYIGEIQFDDSEIFEPGEEKEVSVRFLLTEDLKEYLKVGRKWWLHEGERRIGEAVIIQL